MYLRARASKYINCYVGWAEDGSKQRKINTFINCMITPVVAHIYSVYKRYLESPVKFNIKDTKKTSCQIKQKY